MRQIADNPYAERLNAAMRRHMAHRDFQEPTFRCPECNDVLFVPDGPNHVRPCMATGCPAWDKVRVECGEIQSSGSPKRRKVTKDNLPF